MIFFPTLPKAPIKGHFYSGSNLLPKAPIKETIIVALTLPIYYKSVWGPKITTVRSRDLCLGTTIVGKLQKRKKKKITKYYQTDMINFEILGIFLVCDSIHKFIFIFEECVPLIIFFTDIYLLICKTYLLWFKIIC